MTREEWRPVPGFPGYLVSDAGRVLSQRRWPDRLMSPTKIGRGYLAVALRAPGGGALTRSVHRLVAWAFLGPQLPGMQVRHLDGDKTNNALSNLAYGTASDNMHDQVKHGAHACARRTHCPAGHAYDEANTARYRGRRYCLACRRDRNRAAYVTRTAA